MAFGDRLALGGRALLGISAGLSGQSQQFQQGQIQRRQQEQAEQAQRQEQLLERQKTVFTDAETALGLAKRGEFGRALELGLSRLSSSKAFGDDLDMSETEKAVSFLIAAKSGGEKEKKAAKK